MKSKADALSISWCWRKLLGSVLTFPAEVNTHSTYLWDFSDMNVKSFDAILQLMWFYSLFKNNTFSLHSSYQAFLSSVHWLFTLLFPFLIFPRPSFISVDFCMKSIYRQTTFATCVLSLYSHLQQDRCVPVRAELEGWVRKWGGQREVTSQIAQTQAPDFRRPGRASTPPQRASLTPDRWEAGYTHSGLWVAEEKTAISSWKILLLGKPWHCFCFPFSPPWPCHSQWPHDNGAFSLGGGRWKSREQNTCIFLF